MGEEGKNGNQLNPRRSAPLELAPNPWTEKDGGGRLPLLVKFGARLRGADLATPAFPGPAAIVFGSV